MAITNTAPHAVHIGRNELIRGLDQWTSTEEPIPLDDLTIEKFINKLEAKSAKFLCEPPGSAATLSDEEITQRANLNVPDEFKPANSHWLVLRGPSHWTTSRPSLPNYPISGGIHRCSRPARPRAIQTIPGSNSHRTDHRIPLQMGPPSGDYPGRTPG